MRMESAIPGGYKLAGVSLSPSLLRSKSGSTPAIMPPFEAGSPFGSKPSVSNRSTSATRTRPNERISNPVNTTSQSPYQKKPIKDDQISNGFVMFMRRGGERVSNNTSNHAAKSTRAKPTSPSAWALSPGRYSPCSAVQKNPGKLNFTAPESRSGRGVNGGGISGVLKYFRPKKAICPISKEDYHCFRVIHNRLLQWRFVNARAEASTAAVNLFAQKKLFNAWLRILEKRKETAEKRIEIQSLRHEMKLYQTISAQARLLKEWGRTEGKNTEAIGRLTTKLSAMSIRLPLLHGAQANLPLVDDAVREVTGIMDSIEATVINFYSQVEHACYLMTEYLIMVKEQREHLEELQKWTAKGWQLLAEEKSLRVHLIQEGGQG